MKKFLILSVLLIAAGSGFAQHFTPRRTLIEEFTSSSSDVSAMSDPVINQFEGEAPGNFCIVKWYIPKGTKGGANKFYNDYTLSLTRSKDYYGNDTVSRLFLNGTSNFDPLGLSIDALRSRVAPEYAKTSPFTLEISQQIVGDSLIANITVRQLDTNIDLTRISIGVIVTERFNQTQDVNHIPFHTNIVRTVMPSLDPKSGQIRDALPFALAMQGVTTQTFRFATKIFSGWDRYGLVSVGVIQDNSSKEVLQCAWTVPEVQFSRPPVNSFLLLNGTTSCQFSLRNTSDSDITVFPQLTQTFPSEWGLKVGGEIYSPSFVLKARTSATGTFLSEKLGPFRGSGDFILLLRINPGLVIGSISGTVVGNDSRDLIIKNWKTSVYKSDPDIQTWQQFSLDPAIINDDAIGYLFNNNLLRFRTVYVERSEYGDSSQLESIRNYMAYGGRLIFNSTTVNNYFSRSIVDTSSNKYAVNFQNIFHTIPGTLSQVLWSKGNVVKGNVFSDTLSTPFTVSSRPVEPLVPLDTHLSKPLIKEQQGTTVGVAAESYKGKIAYLTFPLSDIQNGSSASFIMGKILNWFMVPVGVHATLQQEQTLHVFPNPVTTTATIVYNFPANGKVTFALYDELGREVSASFQITGNSMKIDCTSLTSGTYNYALQIDGKVIKGDIIVRH
jgi:hypothetical protein